MPKVAPNIIYIFGIIGKKNTPVRIRYVDYEEDKEYIISDSKPSTYIRQHNLILQVESESGMVSLFASKKFDCDRAKAKVLLEAFMKKYKVVGEIKEWKLPSQLVGKEIGLLVNPNSLDALAKPIHYKYNPHLTMYANGVQLILAKLQRILAVGTDTPQSKAEIKLLHQLIGGVLDKI
ncbi:MAG: hypothetical protein MUE81_21335 [Thermoflexibacter sp.]|jgi:hypothetical protein|nr:hypothetical protein [Thermoflexibacter sp.]